MRPNGTSECARRGGPADRAGSGMSCAADRRPVLRVPRILAAFLSLIVLVFGAASIAGAQTILYVDLDAAGADNGTSWGDAFTDLQDALAASAGGGYEIWVAEGAYTPSVPPGRDATFQLLDGVGLYGGFAGTEDDRANRDWVLHETILSGDLNGDDGTGIYGDPVNRGDNSYHVITGSGTDASAVLDGFTVRGGENNPASGTGNVRGAGMYNVAGSPTIAHCTFSDNHATYGGGMYNESGSDPTVIDCRFSGSNVNLGGGMYNVDSDPTVTDCTFSDNVAGGAGGGMYNKESGPTITGCAFSANYGRGGGMYNFLHSSPQVNDCEFNGNWGGDGGGMCNVAASHPTITGCTFSDGHAAVNGGGMCNEDSTPTVSGCTFIENDAYGHGGGMYNKDSNPTAADCTFEDNSAGEYGGGMYNYGSSPAVSGCAFEGNEAEYHGGGMYNEYGSPTVDNCTFEGNHAGTSGGGMRNRHCDALVTGCTFSNGNRSYAGGGMYNTISSPTIIDCTFSDNVAEQWGGGMCNIVESHPSLSNCTFSGNEATAGGGMYNGTSSPTVADCTFVGNGAAGVSSAGGGMCNRYGSSPPVSACTFNGNSSVYYGGGMYNGFGSDAVVNDCTFSGNEAEHGAGMYNALSSPTVTHCTIFENFGTGTGAGVYNDSNSNPTVKHTILAGNTPDDCYNSTTSAFTSGGYNLESGTSCGCTQTTDRQNTDPLLGPLADNGGPTWTHALSSGSPALDAIPWPGGPTTDQRGFPRPYPAGGLADIGAVEMQLTYSRGDVNGDGTIDLLDVVLCQQIASGIVHGTADQRWAADTDRDGDVDEDDVRILSECVLGTRTTLP